MKHRLTRTKVKVYWLGMFEVNGSEGIFGPPLRASKDPKKMLKKSSKDNLNDDSSSQSSNDDKGTILKRIRGCVLVLIFLFMNSYVLFVLINRASSLANYPNGYPSKCYSTDLGCIKIS